MTMFRVGTDTGNRYELEADDYRDAIGKAYYREFRAGTRHSVRVTDLMVFDPALGGGAGQWISADDLLAGHHRPLYLIAQDVRDHWANVYFGAEPYLRAMERLDKITDKYGADDGETIVNYFVNSNAAAWRGADARRVKAELREMIKR